ncbi:peroxiredoxin family protein [Bacillus solimangrovi]|uniref:Peroxiredoxin n=1 Tax=Bacillus solimangrovi TaxID=1305675 RepID=A0A1E5LC90_9BACI|nr:peroxiredoxin family protein [Bacillus solimangrovi]OEH91704.1 peroxiredoxin [Bacillus solimangrovi]
MSQLQLNDSAPSFTVPCTDGSTFNMSAHLKEHNTWHLLIFFRGSWCPVCLHDLQQLQENVGFFEGKNIHIMTISADEMSALKELVAEHNLSFPVLCDENLEALKAYEVYYHGQDAPYEDHGVHGEPAYFLLNEHGKIMYQQRQTSPFGRPSMTELRKIVQYIQKNLK